MNTNRNMNAGEQELQVQERQDAQSAGEHTQDGPCYAPPVDIFETETEMVVLADMPGVRPEDVDIGLEEGVLSIRGRFTAETVESGRLIMQEYAPGHYLRRFTVAESIDQEGIAASLADGVLRVRLPKARPARPRKIAVTAG